MKRILILFFLTIMPLIKATKYYYDITGIDKVALIKELYAHAKVNGKLTIGNMNQELSNERIQRIIAQGFADIEGNKSLGIYLRGNWIKVSKYNKWNGFNLGEQIILNLKLGSGAPVVNTPLLRDEEGFLDVTGVDRYSLFRTLYYWSAEDQSSDRFSDLLITLSNEEIDQIYVRGFADIEKNKIMKIPVTSNKINVDTFNKILEKSNGEMMGQKLIHRVRLNQALTHAKIESVNKYTWEIYRDLSGVDIEVVLRKLFELARPKGMGYKQYSPEHQLTDIQIGKIRKKGDADYENGRAMKIYLRDNSINVENYNKYNGFGLADKIIFDLKNADLNAKKEDIKE